MPEINRRFDEKNKAGGEENGMYNYNPLVNMQCINTFSAPGLTFDF